MKRLVRALRELAAAIGTARRGLVANRLRAGLSLVGIGLGVATLTAITSITDGMQATFHDAVSELGARTIFVARFAFMNHGGQRGIANPPITLLEAEELASQATRLDVVVPIVGNLGEVRAGRESITAPIRGTSDRFLETSPGVVQIGRFLSAAEHHFGTPVVVLGPKLASRLRPQGWERLVGETITIASRRLTVIGIFRPGGRMVDDLVILPIKQYEKIFGPAADIMIAAGARGDMGAARDEIEEVMRRIRGLRPEQPNNFELNQADDLVKRFSEATGSLVGTGLAVGLICLIVGGVGVMNVLFVSVSERTREIGVRRALGARRRTILTQFLIESILLTITGGAIGCAIGLWGSQIISLVSPIEVRPTLAAAMRGVIVSGVVGLIFGAWPAWRAARLDPAASLRYE